MKFTANTKFKVRRRWWVWVIGIIWNIVAIRWLMIPASSDPRVSSVSHNSTYFLILIVLLVDIFVILPEVSCLYYTFDKGTLIIKRVILSDISIQCNKITRVEKATAITLPGFGVKIFENSMGSYKIVYRVYNKFKVAIVSPKSKEFMAELATQIDNDTILLNNTDSPFKRKKDEI